MAKRSAGILMYRIKSGKPEVLLVHPGGPFWAKKDDKTWSIPKGEAKEGEELMDVARREFEEETGFKAEGNLEYLGEVKSSSGKVVSVWITLGDLDTKKIKSEMVEIEWPPRTGRKIKVPEVDRGDFFDIETALKKVVPYQTGILEAFVKYMA